MPPGLRRSWECDVTGQRGTDYDGRHDLVRVPLRVRALPEAEERLTIAIDPADTGGVLRLIWDMTEASTAFAIQ